MWESIHEDFRRCNASPFGQIRELCTSRGLWALIGYRFRRRLYLSRMARPVRFMLNLVSVTMNLLTEITSGVELPSSAVIGPGLYIPHGGYIVIASDAVIGSHCTCCQGVTIGHRRGGGEQREGSPRIGDRVYLGPGAIVLGPITVGDDALIGAGAVVTRSVPARGVVAGNPARVISMAGSFELINYPGMDSDRFRQASISAHLNEVCESPCS